MKKANVLFLCTGNSCRSQIAEGLLRALGGDRFEAFSAGLEPAAQVHPMAVEVMREIGIDISGQRPKDVIEYLGKVPFRYLIVVCNKAKQTCPRIWPGLDDGNRIYWPVDDPASAEGDEATRLAVFRRVRDELKASIQAWLAQVDA